VNISLVINALAKACENISCHDIAESRYSLSSMNEPSISRISQAVAFRDCIYLLNPKSGASGEYAKAAMVGLASGISAASGIPVGKVVQQITIEAHRIGFINRLPDAWQNPA
jgi:hypothetical protein